MTTRARFLQLNVRRSDLPELRSARKWVNRRGELIKMIKDVGPSAMAVQECTKEQAEYIEAQLGRDEWAYFGAHNARLFVNVAKWRLLNVWNFDLDAGKLPPGTRHLVACHLQKIDTGDTALVCSTHLTPHSIAGAQAWRVKQAHQIGQILPTLPDHEKTILMGDINDTSRAGGVRGALGEHGLKSLRSLHIPQIYDFQLSSFNGWKDSVPKGEWLDEVFTTAGAKPYHAGVERTETKRPLKVVATDHNGIRASVEFSGGLA
ncbi:MAG TPA: endonuclease/exonuclease/phosphatase family protein [Propionibacteriaceae bacterium]|nr:endonuclease/exonuclease/phosphatase family protein [Propionibacteriaceae bacterium]